MISGIHTKHHHPLKISMAGEKVPKDGAGNWHNVSKGKTKAIVKELDYQDVTSQTMVLVNKPKTNGKAAAVANPVGSFESPKINLCTNMILHVTIEHANHDEEKAHGKYVIMPPSLMIIDPTASMCNDQCIFHRCLSVIGSTSTDVYVLVRWKY
ncbi:hypothetical protein V6N12_012950 [Hibiscus sabdariffa]|uniref:Uncharacterized protein n=1 Tax=Hibiscus sabdariffa TaxID=183260 RepID=A0ABR2EGA3_9ROSI